MIQFVVGICFVFQSFGGELLYTKLVGKLSGFHGRRSRHRAACVFKVTGSGGCRNVSKKEVCRK